MGLVQKYAKQLMHLLFSALYETGRSHWNQAIRSLAYNALRSFMEMDSATFEACSKRYKTDRTADIKRSEKRKSKWQQLERFARSNPLAQSVTICACAPEQFSVR